MTKTLQDWINDVANRVELNKDLVIFEQIKTILIAEGKFDCKEWILREEPLEMTRIGETIQAEATLAEQERDAFVSRKS